MCDKHVYKYNIKKTDMKTKGLLMIVFLIGMFFSAQATDQPRK